MKYISNAVEFDAVISSGKKVLVDFFAEWCGPCSMLAPTLEQIADEYTDVEVVKVDVDNAPELAIRFGIESIPLLIFFKNGQPVDSLLGFVGKDKIKNLIEK